MQIGLFIPCYVDQFYPEIGIATLELLEKLDCKVHFPTSQTCCGQPIANSGSESEALPIYENFIRSFSQFDYIVTPSPSCAYHIRKHYDILEQNTEVKHVRKRTLDLTEFLLDILKIDHLDASFPHKVGFHQSCHGLRGLNLAKSTELVSEEYSKWKQLLAMVKDLEIIDLTFPDECCGFGGTFAIQEPAVSVKMGRDRIRDHIDNGAEFIVSGDMSCLMHLQGLIEREKYPVKVIHLAEILNR